MQRVQQGVSALRGALTLIIALQLLTIVLLIGLIAALVLRG